MAAHPTPEDLFARFRSNALAGGTGLSPDMCAEDVVVETPFSPPGRRRVQGRAAWAEYVEASTAAFPLSIDAFRDVVVHRTEDPEVIVAEYTIEATAPDGRRGTVPFVVVLRAHGGRIIHWREYQNIAAITQAMTAQP